MKNNTITSIIGLIMSCVVMIALLSGGRTEFASDLFLSLEFGGLLFKASVVIILFTLYNIATTIINKNKETAYQNSEHHDEDKPIDEDVVKMGVGKLSFHLVAPIFSVLVGAYIFFSARNSGWEMIIAPVLSFLCYFFLVVMKLAFDFLHKKYGLQGKTFIMSLILVAILYSIYLLIVDLFNLRY